MKGVLVDGSYTTMDMKIENEAFGFLYCFFVFLGGKEALVMANDRCKV